MSAFLSGWSYRKKITINGATGAGTDYQILLAVGNTTGGDFNLGGNSANFPTAKNDGGDLRFTADDGLTLLPFWVESVASGVAKIWIKVSANLDTNKNIYIYYGNPLASNASNGDDTFLFFDDFDDTTYDSNKWDVTGSLSTPSASNAIVGNNINSATRIRSKDNLLNGDTYRFKAKGYLARTYLSYHGFGIINEAGVQSSESYISQLFESHWENDPQIDFHISGRLNDSPSFPRQWFDTTLDADGSGYPTGGSPVTNHAIWEIRQLETGSVEGYVDGTQKILQSYASLAAAEKPAITLLFSTYDANRITYVDWVFVSKVRDTEPSFDSAGAEEEGGESSTSRSGILLTW